MPAAAPHFAAGPDIDAMIFWGSGGQAKVLREAMGLDGPPLVALFDNDVTTSSPWTDIPLHHGKDGFDAWHAQQRDLGRFGFLVAIGGSRGNDRLVVQRELVSRGLRPLVACHKTAFVAESSRIGLGSQVLAHAAVCVEVVVGDACIINTAATVDHECTLGDGVHVCPGAHLAGLVVVEENVMIGTGAIVLPRIRIGAGSLIGAGAVVTRDVPPGQCVVGNPARPVSRQSGGQDRLS